MGHRAWGMGHGAWGIGHGALGIGPRRAYLTTLENRCSVRQGKRYYPKSGHDPVPFPEKPGDGEIQSG